MTRLLFLLSFLLLFPALHAQEENVLDGTVVDSLYREDQVYLGFTYNILMGTDEVSQTGFSGGFRGGFIRDFPLNERRNVAVGVGVGWSVNTFGQNLFIGEELESEKTIFQTFDADVLDYDVNRFTIQAVEIPLQFRWRTSTPETYKFWRVYTGLQLGYAYYFKSKFEQSGNRVIQTDVPELERFRLGATFTFGYNTFNFHVYYSLNPFFNKDARLEGEQIDLSALQVGLMFYLL